jgi:hypothetical protein
MKLAAAIPLLFEAIQKSGGPAMSLGDFYAYQRRTMPQIASSLTRTMMIDSGESGNWAAVIGTAEMALNDGDMLRPFVGSYMYWFRVNVIARHLTVDTYLDVTDEEMLAFEVLPEGEDNTQWVSFGCHVYGHDGNMLSCRKVTVGDGTIVLDLKNATAKIKHGF